MTTPRSRCGHRAPLHSTAPTTRSAGAAQATRPLIGPFGRTPTGLRIPARCVSAVAAAARCAARPRPAVAPQVVALAAAPGCVAPLRRALPAGPGWAALRHRASATHTVRAHGASATHTVCAHHAPLTLPAPVLLSVLTVLTASALLAILSPSPASAAYITPGTGATYTLDDLVALSGGAVTGAAPNYQLHESVIVATTDLLSIGAGTRVEVVDTGGSVALEVRGSLAAVGAEGDSIRFESATGFPGDWAGLVFRDTAAGSAFTLRYGVVAHATIAIDVVGADVHVEHCALRGSSEKAFDLTDSNSTLRSSILEDNEKQTIYMTLSSSPVIEGNLLRRNNLLNASPYPYINIGLQGINSPTIRGNTILGGASFRSGGISIWNACHGLIEGNWIEGCGYGILCYQTDASPTIRDNTIRNNTTNPDTVNWGFGIACNGENAPVIAANRIEGHWYGIAVINGGQPNVGDLGNADPGDDGGNQFLGNGLGGELYELYNNSSLDLRAEGNWWGTTDPAAIEDRIVHSVDDPLLGTVDFDPYMDVTGIGDGDIGGDGGNGEGGDGADGSGDGNAGDTGDGHGDSGGDGGGGHGAGGDSGGDSAGGNHGPLGAAGRGDILALSAAPNPTREGTAFHFRLAAPGSVEVAVFDAAGRLVRALGAEERRAGDATLAWDGRDAEGRLVPAGLYLWRVQSGGAEAIGRVSVLR